MTENTYYKHFNQFKRKQVVDNKPKGITPLQSKLDLFIQSSLDLYTLNEKNPIKFDHESIIHKHLFSYKSLIPDLVIYNKIFNKNQCFYEGTSSNFNPFPRTKFSLKKRYDSNDNLHVLNLIEKTNSGRNYEENEEENNLKNTEEIQWENIDAKELKDVKISFQPIPKNLAELKLDNPNNDFFTCNENDEIPDNLEKNLEAIFEIDSKKDNSICNKTNQTEEKDYCLNTSQNNYEDKLLSENTNDDSKKDKFSLFSDLSLFNRNNENVQQSITNQIFPQPNNKEFVTHLQEDKNNTVNDNTHQHTFENSKIFENVCYLENPVALIKKNLFLKNWFVTKNEKLVQCFTSYELFKFLENEINKQKDISSYWVFDNETDIHFTAISIFDNLKDNINELMKELQNNYQQNIMKKQVYLNGFPQNMMFTHNSPKTKDISKVPVIPTNVPLFQPFPPQMMPINNRFIPPPMFMPIPGNFMMNFGMNSNMNLQREKIEDHIKSNIINNVPIIESNFNTTKIGK